MESERTAPAEATRSRIQRTLVSPVMARQLFEHLRAGHWEEAEDMLIMAGHQPLLQGYLAHKKTPPPLKPP